MFRIAAPAALALLVAAGGVHAQERRGPPQGGQPGAGAPATAPAAAPTRKTEASGSFQQSCRNTAVSGERVFSECRAVDGQYRRSSIEFGRCTGDISNLNGLLACNGAVAQDGGLVASATAPTTTNRNGDRNASTGGSQGGYDDRDGRGGAYGGDTRQGGYTGSPYGGGYQGGSYQGGGYQGGAYQNGGYRGGGYQSGGYQGGGYQGGYGAPPPPPAYGYGRGDDRGYGGRNEPRRPALVLYDGVNFTGRAYEVYDDVDNLGDRRFNDRAKSVRVTSGRWKLCREAGYSRCEHVSRDVPDLRTINAADQISSVERE